MRVEVLELSKESRESQVAHAEALRKLEARSRARAIVVPTAVDDVKARLRELGHPVTLFGENHVDRRERLREAIASLELNDEELAKIQELINQGATAPPSSSSSSSGPDGAGAGKAHETSKKEVFYSPAAEALIAARQQLGAFSFARAEVCRLPKCRDVKASSIRSLTHTSLLPIRRPGCSVRASCTRRQTSSYKTAAPSVPFTRRAKTSR